MSDLMQMIVLDCEQASLLLMKKEENKLSLKERFQLWLHQKICDPCTEFDQQNEFMNINLKHHYKDVKIEVEKMPESLRNKLTEVVNK